MSAVGMTEAETVDVERGTPLDGLELTQAQKVSLYNDGFIVLKVRDLHASTASPTAA